MAPAGRGGSGVPSQASPMVLGPGRLRGIGPHVSGKVPVPSPESPRPRVHVPAGGALTDAAMGAALGSPLPFPAPGEGVPLPLALRPPR